MGKTAVISELPPCDFCKMEGREEPAEYDGKTKMGPWANMCQHHFDKYGVGLGAGLGQKLVKPTNPDRESLARADELCRRCGKGCPPDSWNKETGRYRLLEAPDAEARIATMLSLGLYCEEILP